MTPGNTNAALYNTGGQVLMRQNLRLHGGDQQLSLELPGNLPAGFYLLRVGDLRQKLVKMYSEDPALRMGFSGCKYFCTLNF